MLGLAARHTGHLQRAQGNLEASIATLRAAGERQDLARPLQTLGCVLRDLGDTPQAQVALREAVLLARSAGNRGVIAASFVALAVIACAAGQAAIAARLLGATDKVVATTGYVLPPAEQIDSERVTAAVCRALGSCASAAARAEGEAMTLEQAIACALELHEAPPLGV
jgi:hypothetical protein